MLALHHSLGFFAGTFAYLNLADWPEVQRLVFVLIAGPLPGIFGAPLQLFGDLTERSAVGLINVAVTIGGFLFLVYARFFVFIPLAFPLDARIAEEYGSLASGLVAVPLVLFGIFSLVSFIDNLWDIIAAVRVQTSARDRLRICRRLGARLVLHWPTPLHFDEGPYEQAPDNKVALSPAPADAAERA
uniref:Uncharacterized protein n=1 Tax=Zooxanthella nutricula TaxID=1333877 RepID=A0A7S2VT32_9DINO